MKRKFWHPSLHFPRVFPQAQKLHAHSASYWWKGFVALLELPLLVTVPIVLDPGMLTLYVASFLILSTPRYVITPQSHHYSMLCRYSTALSLLHD